MIIKNFVMSDIKDLLNQKYFDALKGDKQGLRRCIREFVFGNIDGISVSFNDKQDIEVHFGPVFFNQATFRKGRYLNSLNYSKILRFPTVLRRVEVDLRNKRYVEWVVNATPTLKKDNLNMKITFLITYISESLNKEPREVTVQELLYYLKELWGKVKHKLRFYEYEF
jgi:hypothetical protein